MEKDTQPYQPVLVDMIGIENGSERFPTDGVARLPPVAGWRNNLTALSQHHNLFFIASTDRILVYQPEFPYQTLKSKQALHIIPDLANPHAPGHISSHRDGDDDHCINHLLVGHLGSQEILVIVTDSGNIAAYYTSAVSEAVQRKPVADPGDSTSGFLGLRPFFTHWVLQSAWGIDIHQEARMIAISSNRPDPNQLAVSGDVMATITVFAFALTATPAEESDSDTPSEIYLGPRQNTDWLLWNCLMRGNLPLRDRNFKILLAGENGHRHNIPNISFVNAASYGDEADPWLLSTDITGSMKLWNVESMTCVRTWFFGNLDSTPRLWLNNQYPGWNVIALDKACFRLARTNDEFIGAARAPSYHGYLDKGPNFNLTSIVSHTPDTSPLHPSHPRRVEEGASADLDHVYSDAEAQDDGGDEEDSDGVDETQSLVDLRLHPPDLSQLSAEYSTGNLRDVEPHDRPMIFTTEAITDPDNDSEAELDAPEPPPQSPPLITTPTRSSQMRRHISRQVTPILGPHATMPEVAIVHCSDSHVRLLGSPNEKFPHLFCANMLRQILPDNLHTSMQGLNFAHMDRLMMHHVMPDLGVLLIATQTGRVAVCALTRHVNGGVLGLRVDWILPTKAQEDKGRRPEFCTLVGLAVSPVQGRSAVDTHNEGHDNDARSSAKGPINIDGIPSSFDPNVVVLRRPKPSQRRNAKKSRTSTTTPPKAQHKKGKSTASERERAEVVEPEIERRKWKEIPEAEDWQVLEASRRYRLMLTYSDLTVLTYEISRGVDTEHVAQEFVSR